MKLNETHTHLKIKYISGWEKSLKVGFIAAMEDSTVVKDTVRDSLNAGVALNYNPIYIIDYIGDHMAAWIAFDQIVWFDDLTLNTLYGKNKWTNDKT